MATTTGTKTIKVRQATAYDQFEFDEYEFREFPTAVPVNEAGEVQKSPYRENGKSWPVVHVESQAELDALMGGAPVIKVNATAIESSPLRVEGEDDIRAALYTQADQAGVKIDKRWSVERLEEALQEAAKAKSAEVV